MDGVASRGLPLSEILTHGDHGLGTFLNMKGEMIVLDGEIYQMNADGSVVHISPEETISPFATVTRFQATMKTQAAIKGKEGLSELLKRLLPDTKNHFLAIRMDGVFKTIDFRTAGGQCFPREGMVSVCSRQTEHQFAGVKGTVIGFRCPEYVMGINMAGEHMHFISDDRERGGHILAMETDGEVDVQVAVMTKFHVELPTGDDEFNTADLKLNEKGIAAVEG